MCVSCLKWDQGDMYKLEKMRPCKHPARETVTHRMSCATLTASNPVTNKYWVSLNTPFHNCGGGILCVLDSVHRLKVEQYLAPLYHATGHWSEWAITRKTLSLSVGMRIPWEMAAGWIFRASNKNIVLPAYGTCGHDRDLGTRGSLSENILTSPHIPEQ